MLLFKFGKENMVLFCVKGKVVVEEDVRDGSFIGEFFFIVINILFVVFMVGDFRDVWWWRI